VPLERLKCDPSGGGHGVRDSKIPAIQGALRTSNPVYRSPTPQRPSHSERLRNSTRHGLQNLLSKPRPGTFVSAVGWSFARGIGIRPRIDQGNGAQRSRAPPAAGLSGHVLNRWGRPCRRGHFPALPALRDHTLVGSLPMQRNDRQLMLWEGGSIGPPGVTLVMVGPAREGSRSG
jgi:hypothetical protein